MARDGFDREAPRDEWREARKKPVVVEGEVYPCGLDIFRETYEQVSS